jgi:MFS superfamily sulfate permease-like transporter
MTFPLSSPPATSVLTWRQFPTAFVSAVVGIVDSVVAARENGSKYGYAVSPNRELVALGTANLGASLMAATGGIPVFGSITSG